MKQKLTLLLLALFTTVGAWATDINVGTSTGTFYNNGTNAITPSTTNQFAKKWVASTAIVLQITCNSNNMIINSEDATDTKFRLHSDTYTMTVPTGYIITGYSISAYASNGSSKIDDTTVGTDDASATTVSKTGLSSNTASFTVSGTGNPWMYIKSFTVTVAEDPAYITSLSAVNPNKCYTVTCNRSAWAVANDGTSLTTIAKLGLAASSSDSKQQFAFVTPDNGANYYLYSVNAGKFITSSNTLSDNPVEVEPIYFADASNFKPRTVRVYFNASKNINVGGSSQITIDTWNTADDGCAYLIAEAADFDPSDALAPFATTITVTYKVYDGESLVESLNVVQDKNSAVSIPAALMKNTWYYDYAASGTIGESDCTITVNRTYKSGVVTSLDGLSNNKAYSLVTERGTFTTDNGELANTAKTGSNYTIYNFAIVQYESAYYLWSVQDGKFVAGNDKALTETPTSITINTLEESPLFKIQCGSNYLNCNVNGGGFFSSWSTTDGGNRVAIIEAADFDPTPVIEALTNFAPSVVANIKPFFDAAGSDLFQLKASVAEANDATYTAALTSCNAATYDALLAVVSNADNFNLPEAGKFYLVKNNYNGKYMRVTASGKRGTVFANLTAEEAAKDASAHFTFVENNSHLYMSTQGEYLNWVYNSNGYEGFTSTNFDKYVHFAVPAPGVGAFSIALGNGEGSYEGDLPNGFYSLWNESTGVIAGSSNGAANAKAQWTFEEVSTLSITLNGPIDSYYYATFCVPFDVNFGTSAAAFTLSKDGTTLETTEVPGNTVPAGTPVLLVGEGNSATATIGSNYTNAPVSGTALTGNFFAIPFDGTTNYTLGTDGTKVGFYHWNGTTLNANRAYVAGSGSGVKGFVLNFDDDATAIKDLTDLKDSNGLIFNLAGQRISKMQKGINIINGKKIVVK